MSPVEPQPAAGDASALPPGTRIDDYEIRQCLGSGGFGLTYLARDLQLDLPVALKEFFPAECAHRGPDGEVLPRGSSREAFAAGLERFVEEARALANFRHPNIVRVLRHLRSHGTACIVMEYERGEALPRWLARHQPLTEPALLALLLPLLAGLEAVHQAGFLHRDIKPDNIYVRADGQPVLLDFGAARRLLAGGAATNIVSPGFAPFEQYHSRGEQGPWSDLYALGAVMYWMVTGRKPLEAAARIESDGLVPPGELVPPGRFGEGLLRAITWALQPQPQHRPRSVAAFRETLLAATGPSLAVLPHPSPAQLAPLTRRNLLATIAFLDLVAWSALPVDEQVGAKSRLNALLVRVLQGVPPERCLALDTGDGAALCFLGDPEEALDCLLLLRDLAAGRPGGGALALRIGMHLGPVRVVTDLNDRINVVGDGINVAQRVMSFAQARELLVSGSLHACLAPISERRARQFRFLGQRQDKHGRVHELYAVAAEPGEGAVLPAEPTGAAGPGRVAIRVASREPDEALPRTMPLPGRARSPSGPADSPWHSAPLWPTQPSAPSRPFSAEVLSELEAILSQQLGPMARVLVRQQARQAPGLAQLVEALAGHIAQPARREAFRAVAGRLLGG